MSLKEKIMKTKYKPNALYVHIPFCKHICTYCDFKKFIYNQERVEKYFASLFIDLNKYENHKYHSIYIGGGTPSCIASPLLENLLAKLEKLLFKKNYEFCIECNVEDIDIKLLELFKKYRVNRLSIGVQTFDDKYINYCNRHHDKKMAIDHIFLAKKYIDNISIDLIFAYQGQSIKQIDKDIKTAMSLPITHLSYYSLLIEENTILWAKKVENVSDDIQAKMYRHIVNKLKKYGFNRYEISSFAKEKKYESIHNKVYWHNEHYDAVGLSASGYYNNIRYVNQSNINKYINHDYSYMSYEKLTKDDIMFNEIMLRLRLDEGLNIKNFNEKFHEDFLKKYHKAIEVNKKYHLLVIKNDIIKTSFKGSLLLNDVLEQFL